MKTALRLLLIFSLTLCLLSGSVLLTAACTPVYRFFAPRLARQGGLSETTVIANYRHLIQYCLSFGNQTLSFTGLPMSPQGKTHFQEVRALFQGLLLLFFLSMLLSLLLFLLKRKGENDRNVPLRPLGFSLLLFPALLALPLALHFDHAFILFHKLFFRNDYWLFDPLTDPIILYLPASFFFTEAALILLLVLIVAAACLIAGRKKPSSATAHGSRRD